MAAGQAYADRELYSTCQALVNKFEEIKAGKKVFVTTELKNAIRLLLFGAKPETLHPNFKKAIFHFLCHVITNFSDVLAAQNGINNKNKILVVLLLKLLYTNISEIPTQLTSKKLLSTVYSIIQRNFDDFDQSAKIGQELNQLTYQALDPQSGHPRQAILKLPYTLSKEFPWKFEQAGDISKYLCQWLLVLTTQNSVGSSGGKKNIFQSKSPAPGVSIVLEIDGSPCRDIFTVLNISKNYLKEHLLNVYTFAVLKSWLNFTFSQGDMNECLTTNTTAIKFLKGTPTMTSHSNSPFSSTFGGSRFYDDLDSESSAESRSVSSFASSPTFSQFDELSNDHLARKPFDTMSMRSTTPSFVTTRKVSKAFDTASIVSDIFSNSSNLRNVAAKYCLRIIVQSEKIPQKDSDRSMITASVVEAIQILDLLCDEDSNFSQKVYTEIKKLYKRLEEKPVAARRVLVALVQFYINHHEEMMVQVDDVLEIYFRHIPAKLYTSQTTTFEAYELCLRNSEFFRNKTKILIKYIPNFFRFAAWWPCNFLEEACEILSIFVNPQTAAEVLHLILDLPCLAAVLQLQHLGFMEDLERLQGRLKTEIPTYYKAMFQFVLREKSSGAETIDKMPELHKLLTEFNEDPLVLYVFNIVPPLLSTFFKILDELNSEDIYKKIFPILIERVFHLFPTNTDHGRILELFGSEIKYIAESYPEVVSVYSGELLSFLELFQTNAAVQKSPWIANAILQSIGDAVLSVDNNTLWSLYNNLEELIYEAVQRMGSTKDDDKDDENNVLSKYKILQSLLATICKIAAHAQDLIQRAIVCLNKVITFDRLSTNKTLVHLKSYAQELTNILNKPQVAPAVLCGRAEVVPWHLCGDSSLMLKIHMLSQQADA